MEDQTSMGDQFLALINRIIEENIPNENFSVEELAEKAGISRSMMHRKLIKLTGKSATDLIQEKRLVKACELLEKDVATASEVAYRVGFSSPSYFNSVFKKYYKISPGNFRKKALLHAPAQADKLPKIPKPLVRPKFFIFGSLAAVLILGTLIIWNPWKEKPLLSGEEKDLSEKSIAILPFDNLSSNMENRYFADGIVEDLLNRLSSIHGLRVISRTSSEVFRDKGNKTVPEIAKLLGVRYILEGSVQREKNNVRITIQLIDAQLDNHIVSKQYDHELRDVFTIQSEVAREITSELSIALSERQKLALSRHQTTNLKAFDFVQLGRYHLNMRTTEDNFASIAYFRRAIEEDPDYALAYAELADAYYIASWYRLIDRKTGRDSAVYLAQKALEMDPDVGEAHTVLGAVYYEYDWEYERAEDEFKKALVISPNHSPAYQYYAELQAVMGRLDDARKLLNKALQLDPYSFVVRVSSFVLYYKQRMYDQAITEGKICQQLSKTNDTPEAINFMIYVESGNYEAAVESFKRRGEQNGKWTPMLVDSIYQSEGIRGLLAFRLKTENWTYPFHKANTYILMGEKDTALTLLEEALEQGVLGPWNTSEAEYRAIRSEPRFMAIRKKMGLPPLK